MGLCRCTKYPQMISLGLRRPYRALASLIIPGSFITYCDTTDAELKKNRFGQWPEWSRKWNPDWDHRHPRDVEIKIPAEKQKTIHLIMVRHGQFDLKEKGLTKLGEEQAALTGNRIADLARGCIADHYGRRRIKIARVYHSDVKRAVQTAQIITSKLDPDVSIEVDPMLAEGWPCIPEPYRDPESIQPSKIFTESARVEAVFRKYCHRVTDFKTGDPIENAKTPPGEPGPVDTPADQESEEEYIVLICHQNIIRYFVCRALQLPPEAWLRFRGSNCGVTEIIISDDGRVALEKFADVGHLPVTHHTFH
jgi:serine/threonine-protein phosphatase PGAM5